MLLKVCASILCLVSASCSAPPACEELVRPVDQLDLRHLEGKWAMVAGSLSYLPNLEKFKQRDSAAVNFSSNTSDTSISYTGSIRLHNECQYKFFNIFLEGDSFIYEETDKNISAKFVRTSCHDCILMHIHFISKEHHHVYLFSRRRQLEQTEMEEFSAQMQCLNMPAPVVMDPTKELCPEKMSEDPTAQPEEKTQTQKN